MDKKTKTPKGCFTCVKRRIICDWTQPTCAKCAKKGLKCPGYGIRYRFAKQQPPTKTQTKLLIESTRAVARPVQITFVDDKSTPIAEDSDDVEDEDIEDVDDEVVRHELVKVDSRQLAVGNEAELIVKSPWSLSAALANPAYDFDEGNAISEPSSPMLMPALEIFDSQTRMLLSHFSDRVSPVMIMFDGTSNGYRHSILPLASFDPVVQRAVSVTSALHLAQYMPELRAPAEGGRAAIISKLRTDAASGSLDAFSDTTWTTILLLIVGDLVTGHEDVLVLHQMLNSFMMARGTVAPQGELQRFLLYQSSLFSLFASIAQGESSGVARLQGDLNAVNTVEALIPCPRSGAGQTRISLYNEAFRRAAQIYLHRSQSFLMPGTDFQAMEMLNDLKQLLFDLDPTADGAHTLVWPYFIAAAESATEEHRKFFLGKLQHIEQMTRYRNVTVAIEKLPDIWKTQKTERWTAALPRLMTVVM